MAIDSADLLFIPYTAGTAGKLRGVLHTRGGGMSVRPVFTTYWVFDTRDTDVYWPVADIGWITSHSYIAYGPLCISAMSTMYGGSIGYPDFGRWFPISLR